MNDQQKNQTASYIELANETYTLLVDAIASTNHRALRCAKSVYEIASKPYTSSTPASAYRETFDRINQLIELTVHELQANGQQASELGRALMTHGARLQETWVATARGLAQASISNLNYVKDATETQVNDFAKRVEEMAARTERSVASAS
jgi:hypothetical protein